jgi:hypothetical protein
MPGLVQPVAIEEPEDPSDEQQDNLIERAWYGQEPNRAAPPERSRDPAIARKDLHCADTS